MPKRLLVAAAVAVLSAPVAVRAADQKDIVDTAVAAGSFKTLATALQAAGLVETLKGKGPFTVFAPTDEAFAKIPKADLDALIADKAKLTKVLTYHVVAGKVMAADVMKLKEAKTVEGQMVKIDTSNGVKVNNARSSRPTSGPRTVSSTRSTPCSFPSSPRMRPVSRVRPRGRAAPGDGSTSTAPPAAPCGEVSTSLR